MGIAPDWLTGELAAEMVRGTIVTIVLVIVTSIGATVLGLAAALGRRSSNQRWRRVATVYVEIFRNVPALILLIFFAFAIPNVVNPETRRTLFFDNPLIDLVGAATGLAIPYYALAAAAALILNTGAHLAEIFRTGMDAIPSHRLDASRTHGATSRQTHWFITIPDGLRISFPAATNRLVHNLKNTALVGLVAVPDAFQEIRGAIDETFEATQLLLFAAMLYLMLALLLELGLHHIERRLWRGRPIDRSVDV